MQYEEERLIENIREEQDKEIKDRTKKERIKMRYERRKRSNEEW